MPHTLRKSEDCYVDELFEPVVGARRAADRRALSARLSRRQSRALRARSGAVHRPRARIRQHAVGPRRRRARHHRPHRRRHRGNLSRAAADRGRLRAHRAAVSSVPRGAGRSAGDDPQAFRHRRPDRLPLDAVRLDGPAAGRAARISCSATGSAPPATPSSRASCATCCRAPATTCRSTVPMPAASSPNTTATRLGACSPCSSRSTEALYLDEATLSKSKDFPKLARTLTDMAAKIFAALPLLLERRAAAE